MANSINAELEGKFVVLKADVYKGDKLKRIFFCESGFGTSPSSNGKAVFGYFVSDGEQCRVEGYDIERFAREDEVEEAKKLCEHPVITAIKEFAKTGEHHFNNKDLQNWETKQGENKPLKVISSPAEISPEHFQSIEYENNDVDTDRGTMRDRSFVLFFENAQISLSEDDFFALREEIKKIAGDE